MSDNKTRLVRIPEWIFEDIRLKYPKSKIGDVIGVRYQMVNPLFDTSKVLNNHGLIQKDKKK